MKQRPLFYGALLGMLTSLPLMALSFLGWQAAELPFLPFDLFEWVARTLPGDVVTFGIDSIVNVINRYGMKQP